MIIGWSPYSVSINTVDFLGSRTAENTRDLQMILVEPTAGSPREVTHLGTPTDPNLND